MKIPNNFLLYGVALAVCDAMRHTGNQAVTGPLSSQINGSIVENVPKLLEEAEKRESQHMLTIVLNREESCFDQLVTLKTRGTRQDRFTKIAPNTAPLRHYKNPPRPRRA
jgi:hypothetical protein